MTRIVTLTLNPAIDGACDAGEVRHTHKVRTTNERYDAGGGGINVARVIDRLGGDVMAVYLAGGATGSVLDSLLDRDRLPRTRIDIADHTRISLAVHEASTGREFRFVPEGPLVTEGEWRACLASIEATTCGWLVLSGSLPRGVTEDFYVQAAEIARARGVRVILDTSGAALARTLAKGGIFLAKPSLGEMEQVAGTSLRDSRSLAIAARHLVEQEKVQYVAVSMGHGGALLAHAGGTLRLPAIPVKARSAVGAGDSFVGAMTQAFAAGWTPEDAFRFGIAAGTAAVMTPGTGLCHRREVIKIFNNVMQIRCTDKPSAML